MYRGGFQVSALPGRLAAKSFQPGFFEDWKKVLPGTCLVILFVINEQVDNA